MKYFIGNWKMFGIQKSINIPSKINSYINRDKKSNKYKVIITPPFTLLESYSKKFKHTKLSIGAQNCFYKDIFSSNTGAISPYMIKALGVKYVIIGHSDNRSEGDTDIKLNDKVKFALKNNLKVIFCIGENKIDKRKKQTFKKLKNQITKVLNRKFNKNNLIIAYEPIWSIGTGKIPSPHDLIKTIKFIRKELVSIFKNTKVPPILYGGSVDGSNVSLFKNIREIDGFLIGGASKSYKNFVDIIKNYYR